MSKLGLRTSAAQKGFTLIEMSIVLVIIGLIIGGILKGQEVIESSRQKNLITQIDATRSAVTTFVERFKSLPGDFACANAGGASCPVARLSTNGAVVNGGGNGIVSTAAATSAATIASNTAADVAGSEELQFWIHMNVAGLIGGVSPTNVTPAAFGNESALPAVSIPAAGLSISYGLHASTVAPVTSHWLVVHRTAGAAATAALTPKQMFALDSKTDDAIGATGNFRTEGTVAACGVEAATVMDYVPTDETVSCIAEINLIQ